MNESTYEPTETPRTNKRCREIRDARLAAEKTGYECDSPDMTSLARELERDLNQLRAGIKHLQKMSASEMRLQMGEMTASEIRLVRAITNALLAMPNVER
jgi:ABC-type methionine transport system ATPase subunit